jgi:phosphoglycerate dehydrogenase-like enzyme
MLRFSARRLLLSRKISAASSSSVPMSTTPTAMAAEEKKKKVGIVGMGHVGENLLSSNLVKLIEVDI